MIQIEKEFQVPNLLTKIWLVFGILSSFLYITADILAALKWEEYSYASQMVSELMAIGAPTRSFLIVLFTIYNALVVVFGIGVWGSARRKFTLRFTGILLVAYAIIGQLTLIFFPMHLRGTGKTLTDTMHIIFTTIGVLLTFLYIGFGAAALGKGFRFYSVITILILLLFGILGGMQGPRIEAGLPTPWFGIIERINIYFSLLWVVVLAIILIREGQRENLTL
jgi:hypothetical protein